METIKPFGAHRTRPSECGRPGSRLSPPAEPAVPAGGPDTPRRILVAEDDVLNRLLIVRLLEKLGHQVTVARNGREAVPLAAAEAFDLVFMDMLMPEMSGPEATRAIRRSECSTRSHLPIIALTASGDPGDRALCLAAGMDGYASKPLSSQELAATIRRFATTGG